jgi:hypothetical protein
MTSFYYFPKINLENSMTNLKDLKEKYKLTDFITGWSIQHFPPATLKPEIIDQAIKAYDESFEAMKQLIDKSLDKVGSIKQMKEEWKDVEELLKLNKEAARIMKKYAPLEWKKRNQVNSKPQKKKTK